MAIFGNNSAELLEDLINTRENSYKLFRLQLTSLSKEGQDLYLDFLRNNLTEIKIEKILEKYFHDHYHSNSIENIIQLKMPFIKTEPLTNEQIYKANEQFLNRKYKNLIKILAEVNNDVSISDKSIPRTRNIDYLTFRYRYSEKDKQLSFFTNLYSSLVMNKFVEENTPNGNNANKFKALFKGNNEKIKFENRIIWIGSDFQLKFLIQNLLDNQIVESEFANRWLITSNCFSKLTKNKETKEREIIEFVPEKFPKTTAKGNKQRLNKIRSIIESHSKDLGIKLKKDIL